MYIYFYIVHKIYHIINTVFHSEKLKYIFLIIHQLILKTYFCFDTEELKNGYYKYKIDSGPGSTVTKNYKKKMLVNRKTLKKYNYCFLNPETVS